MKLHSIAPVLVGFQFFILYSGPVVAQYKCRGAFDMYFILDKSSSVSPPNFHDKTVAFVSNVVSNFLSDKMRLSFIVFSSTAEITLKLTADRDEINKGLDRLRKVRVEGDTHVEYGLEKANDQIRRLGHDTASIILVVTDGRFQKEKAAYIQADKAREEGASIFVIGVGPIKVKQLNRVANTPASKFVYHEANYDEIGNVVQNIVNESCIEILTATPSETCVEEDFNVTLRGRGFLKTDNINKVKCSYKFNSTYRRDTKPFQVSYDKISCPGFPLNSPGSVATLEVSVNGKTYVSSNFTVMAKLCLFLSGAVPEHACTSEEPFQVGLLGNGFSKTLNSSNAQCEMKWNSTFTERVKVSEIQHNRLFCPVRAMPETGFVTVRVTLDGEEFIHGAVNITFRHCAKAQYSVSDHTGTALIVIFLLLFLLLLLVWWFWPSIRKREPDYSQTEVDAPPAEEATGPPKSKWPTVNASLYGGGGVGGVKPVRVHWGEKGSTEAGNKLTKAKDAKEMSPEDEEGGVRSGVGSGKSKGPGCVAVAKAKILACFGVCAAAVVGLYTKVASYRPRPGGPSRFYTPGGSQPLVV